MLYVQITPFLKQQLRGMQALALPVIMSGRDCIGVATTGSGKTLAYVLPMLRNVNDAVVRGLDESLGNGPLGLIVAPTRELVQQVRMTCHHLVQYDCTVCSAE